MLTFLRMSLSGLYPKVTLSSCSKGGEIFSVSGNLNEGMVAREGRIAR
jgi:hypothetical protein